MTHSIKKKSKKFTFKKNKGGAKVNYKGKTLNIPDETYTKSELWDIIKMLGIPPLLIYSLYKIIYTKNKDGAKVKHVDGTISTQQIKKLAKIFLTPPYVIFMLYKLLEAHIYNSYSQMHKERKQLELLEKEFEKEIKKK